MPSFTLDTSTLGGSEDAKTRVRLTGFARWFQFRLQHTAQAALTLVGFVAYVVSAGERRGDA